ncbi:type I pantothenate kinase [Liquorilactobacillus mali]|uniref:Phosphoribulokinase/uridine kinase domain-containing protein n=1 Tax=Liquorilactobacillus mali TaxID=1618 RepID=A0A0R2FDH0_9LACO|nr:hypothetical protein [Liquorilactobacillus mali]KRN26626.1 hypothetical protein IV36_GL001783 [Liquorilactobacillus mali]
METKVLDNSSFKNFIVSIIRNNLRDRPVVIGITGNVASGKTTLASEIEKICKTRFPNLTISNISTDNFLYTNSQLKARNLYSKKGFPESYNYNMIRKFIHAILAKKKIELPLYSHKINDINLNKSVIVNKPDIVILEGLLILQPEFYQILNESIFIDVDETSNYKWFKQRCLKLNLSQLDNVSDDKFIEIVKDNWTNINLKNYYDNVLPLKVKATIKLKLDFNHSIRSICF